MVKLSRAFLGYLLLCHFAFLGCLRWKETISSGSSGCSGDAACADDQRCQSGRCVSPSDSTFCTSDSHCTAPRTCRGGSCRDFSCTPEEQKHCAPDGCLGGDCRPCERQGDCEFGKVCEQGACLLPLGSGCVTHDDCVSQICCPSTQRCAEDCSEGTPYSSCRVDAFCFTGGCDGYTCEGCSDEECLSRVCGAVECDFVGPIYCGSCDAGRNCVAGKCENVCPGRECGWDDLTFCGNCPYGEYCGPGRQCESGACDPRLTWCEGNELWSCESDLGPMDICQQGEICVPGNLRCVAPCEMREGFCVEGAFGPCGTDGQSLAGVTRDCRAEELDCSPDGCGTLWGVTFNGYGGSNDCNRPGMIGSVFKALAPRILTGIAIVGDVVGEAHFTFRVHRGLTEDGPFELILEKGQSVLGESGANPRMIESGPLHVQLLADEYYVFSAETLDSLGTFRCIQGALIQEYGGLAHVGKGYELPAYPAEGLGTPLVLTAPFQIEYFELADP